MSESLLKCSQKNFNIHQTPLKQVVEFASKLKPLSAVHPGPSHKQHLLKAEISQIPKLSVITIQPGLTEPQIIKPELCLLLKT